MTKLYFLLATIVTFVIGVYGYVLPYLLGSEQEQTELVAVGFVVLFFSIPVLGKLVLLVIKESDRLFREYISSDRE